MSRRWFARILLLFALFLGTPTLAQDPAEPAPRPAATAPAGGPLSRARLMRLLANPMSWPLVLCSVVAVGFALERLVALRRRRVIPKDFTQRFLERLAAGKLDRERATELCRAHDSPAARVFGNVVRYWGAPASTIRQAIGFDAAGEVADLKRNVRVLNGTATLAPLLGLLGTVVGLIESFDALGGKSVAGTPKGEALAHGISLALGATAMGLVIAVFSVAAYYYLIGRIDALTRELEDATRKVIDLVAADEARPVVPERRPGMAPAYRSHEA